MRSYRGLIAALAFFALALVIAFVTSCESARAGESEEEQRPAVADPLPVKEDPAPSVNRAPLAVKHTEDPYAGWKSWCEAEELTPCKTAEDCSAISHPSGRDLKCIRPWYAERDSDLRVCSPGFSNRRERDYQRARIRELVRLQYSGESESCVDGRRCSRATARGDKLAALLNLVAQRETTMRPWKRHRLNGDVAYARTAWEKTAKSYEGGNKHYRQRWRWEYGLGLYGANAALFTRLWSKAAPPEVLCREVEATEAYLRAARRGWRKLAGGIDCDGKPGREWFGVAGRPTWYDVHHYASGGRLCPSDASKRNFEAVAKRAGIPAFAPISLSDLGEPIDPQQQNQIARALTTQLDAFSANSNAAG